MSRVFPTFYSGTNDVASYIDTALVPRCLWGSGAISGVMTWRKSGEMTPNKQSIIWLLV